MTALSYLTDAEVIALVRVLESGTPAEQNVAVAAVLKVAFENYRSGTLKQVTAGPATGPSQ